MSVRVLLIGAAMSVLCLLSLAATQPQKGIRPAPPGWVGTASVTFDGVKYVTPDDVRAGNITAEAQAKVGKVALRWKSKGKDVYVEAEQGGGEKPHEFKARVKKLVEDMEDLFPPDPEPPQVGGQ